MFRHETIVPLVMSLTTKQLGKIHKAPKLRVQLSLQSFKNPLKRRRFLRNPIAAILRRGRFIGGSVSSANMPETASLLLPPQATESHPPAAHSSLGDVPRSLFTSMDANIMKLLDQDDVTNYYAFIIIPSINVVFI